MAFNVSLTSFKKRENSTAVPNSFSLTAQCTVKQGMDILSPVIGFNFGLTNSYTNYNYAYISVFTRYYFIKNWEWRDGLWWAYLEVDVLASYKAQIANSTFYIERASAEYNNRISDNLYPSTSDIVREQTAVQDIWAGSFVAGCYIVGVLSGTASNASIAYYAFDSTAMSTLRNLLYADTAYLGQIEDISNDLLKTLLNPLDYIVSAMWFPVRTSDITGTTQTSIKIGWWTVTLNCKLVSNFTLVWDANVIVKPNSMATTQGGGFRYASPFSKYGAWIPPFGDLQLPSDVIADLIIANNNQQVTLKCSIFIDLITGIGHLILYSGTYGTSNAQYIMQSDAQIGVETVLAQSQGQSLQSVGEYIAKETGGDSNLWAGIVGATSTIIEGATNFIANLFSRTGVFEPTSMTKFNNGTILNYLFGFYTYTEYHTIVDENINEFGRPLYATRQISALQTGYIKTINADVSLTGATIREVDRVKAYLDRGFFYE